MILINFDGHSSKIDEINAETDISWFYPKSVPLPLNNNFQIFFQNFNILSDGLDIWCNVN